MLSAAVGWSAAGEPIVDPDDRPNVTDCLLDSGNIGVDPNVA
jgi:hypothetical protein